MDGQSPVAGDRVLVKNETGANDPYNGIYVVTAAGSAGTVFVLTRALDFDNGSPSGEIPGAFTFVEAGTYNADTGWVCTTNAPVLMGTTAIVFAQFSGAGQYTANTSAGLALNGTVFSAKVDGNVNPTTAFDAQGNIYVPAGAAFTTPNVGAATGTSLSVTGTVTAAAFAGPLASGTSNVSIPASNGNVNLTAGGNTTLVVTATGANIAGTLSATGNITAANFIGNVVGNISGNISIPGSNTSVVFNDGGVANSSTAFTFNKDSNVVTVQSVLAVTANTKITGATVTTSSTNATVVATFPKVGVTGVEYIVKGINTGNAYSMATVQAITDGTNVDYAVFGTLGLGNAAFTDLAVIINSSNIELTVNAASATSTVWTTQYRLI